MAPTRSFMGLTFPPRTGKKPCPFDEKMSRQLAIVQREETNRILSRINRGLESHKFLGELPARFRASNEAGDAEERRDSRITIAGFQSWGVTTRDVLNPAAGGQAGIWLYEGYIMSDNPTEMHFQMIEAGTAVPSPVGAPKTADTVWAGQLQPTDHYHFILPPRGLWISRTKPLRARSDGATRVGFVGVADRWIPSFG